MAEITAHMVKELRDTTGVGMMDCKKALVEANGNAEAALDYLRKAGVAKAAKRAGREAKEGKIVAHIDNNVGVLLELLCETDFVARNETFNAYAAELATKTVVSGTGNGDVSEAVGAAEEQAVAGLVGMIGEKIALRRVLRWEGNGQLAFYLHMGGRIGVMIDVVGEADAELLNNICLHIAAFNPTYASPTDVSASVIEKEREIAAAQVVGKPANILEKIVDGKIAKWYQEVCLTHQPWIRDDKTTLAKLAPKLTVTRFVRWQIGESL